MHGHALEIRPLVQCGDAFLQLAGEFTLEMKQRGPVAVAGVDVARSVRFAAHRGRRSLQLADGGGQVIAVDCGYIPLQP